MKKTTLALAIIVTTLTSVTQAAYQADTYYTGAKLGWSTFVDTKSEQVKSIYKINRNNIAAGAFVGYQANPYIAAELGYDWLGAAKYKSNTHRDSKITVQGVSFTGKLSYPLSFISKDLDIYARAGAFVSIAQWQDGTTHHNSSKTKVSPTYALGFDYRLSYDFSTRLEYQWVQNITNNGPVRPNNGLLTFGMNYRLGSPTAVRPVEIKTIEKRYALNSNVLFGYGKANLKPEGRDALDSLLTGLMKVNPSQSTIVVIGHTDRLGSNRDNQKISERRANTVIKYLISKGIPPGLISSRGAGNQEPITGEECNSLRGTTLRTCLAADRRVEIEVKARNIQDILVPIK